MHARNAILVAPGEGLTQIRQHFYPFLLYLHVKKHSSSNSVFVLLLPPTFSVNVELPRRPSPRYFFSKKGEIIRNTNVRRYCSNHFVRFKLFFNISIDKGFEYDCRGEI